MSQYRVWWIPQVPMKAFYVEVADLPTAVSLLDILADYDLFQFENNIKPDYSNTGGVQIRESDEGEWSEVDEAEFDGVPITFETVQS